VGLGSGDRLGAHDRYELGAKPFEQFDRGSGADPPRGFDPAGLQLVEPNDEAGFVGTGWRRGSVVLISVPRQPTEVVAHQVVGDA
jgi:hypothetical protein